MPRCACADLRGSCKKRAGREREMMVCLVWFGVARTVAASLWPFGRSREPPLPDSGLLCDD